MTAYVFRDRGTEVMIQENGHVEAFIKDADVSALDPDSQFGQVELKVDSIIADTMVDLRCHKGLCSLERTHKHHQCNQRSHKHHDHDKDSSSRKRK